ncbi:hypothetical protein [Aquiflexum sp.]|uniref:hypothetical protein n=1 Tax=Aquiflexum sp. TaxID=1872584 RepID=UPI003593706C
MRNFSFAGNLNKVWMLAIVAFMVACSQFEAQGPDDVNMENAEELASAFNLTEMNSGLWSAMIKGTASTPISTVQLITPYIIDGDNPGGNRTCEEVADAFGLDPFQVSSDRVNYDGGAFDASFPAGFNITTNGTTVNWSFIPPAGKCLDAIAFIVKGSNDANVYVYGSDIYSDSGLASPVNASGGSAGLSNLTICYTLRDCDEQKCYDGETAWAAGTRYVTRGNWATYSTKAALEAGVTLFAGQTMNAGTVKLVGEEIIITLNAGFRFAFKDENVKIQHYSAKPAASNPAPGQFFTKGNATESPFSIPVPTIGVKFYGVHVDVEREVECPVED